MKLLKLIRKVRARCYRTAKVLGDVQAVLQGRIVNRYAQRKLGAMSRRNMNKVLKWKK